MKSFDVQQVRNDFPILKEKVNGKPLIYLDNGATSQKPLAVIEAMNEYYSKHNSNIHRGVHFLSEKATEHYEQARVKIQKFLGAKESKEIIFVRGATEAINLVASSFGRSLKKGDEVIISAMEHHANIVPWQILAEDKGIVLRVIPITESGELRMDEYKKLLNERTKLVSVIHVSNVLGTVNPVKEIIQEAHKKNVPVLLDGAQAVPHKSVNVQELDCDFYVFSGHKMFGPTGIGILYGKKSFLEKMPPYQGGGDMIRIVTFEKTEYNELPYKFEAGTPDIAGAIGLGAAIDYWNQLDHAGMERHEKDLLDYGTKALQSIPGVTIIGTAKDKDSILSFVMGDIHPHDIGTILDQEGVAIRTGHHCAMPLMKRLELPATARASLAFYNTREDIDVLVKALQKVKEVFA